MKKKWLPRLLLSLAVIVIIIFMFFPFYWLFIMSLKGDLDLYKMPPDWIAKNPRWDNYKTVFTDHNLGQNMINSFLIAFSTTLISILIGSWAAYALAKFRMKFKSLILGVVLAVSMFPGIVVVSPLYMQFTDMKIINTYWALILPYLTFSLPMTIWILQSFFKQIPDALTEASVIDGAGPMRTLFQILFPLAAPGIFTAFILTFIGAWNELLFASIFITDYKKFTVPRALTLFSGQYTSSWQLIAAASVVITLPLIIMVLLLQKWIVAGLTAGGVKD